MSIVTVRFTNVGRDKKSWDETIPLNAHGEIPESSLVRSIKDHHALASRDIDFDDMGGIWVGGLRKVGDFEIIGVTPATHASELSRKVRRRKEDT